MNRIQRATVEELLKYNWDELEVETRCPCVEPCKDEDAITEINIYREGHLIGYLYERPGYQDTIWGTIIFDWGIIIFNPSLKYDPNYGDDKPCANCGHVYYRHFDSYDDMKLVGCKYCSCEVFKPEA